MIRSFAAILLLACTMQAKVDIWMDFHPETVKAFGCKIKEATSGGVVGDAEEFWVTDVWASRINNDPDFNMALAYYPLTSKGRSKAMKECDRWMTEADKQVKKAQAIPKSAGRLPAR